MTNLRCMLLGGAPYPTYKSVKSIHINDQREYYTCFIILYLPNIRRFSTRDLSTSKMGGYVEQLLAPGPIFLLAVLSTTTLLCYQTYYQLWLSPLAIFPGPKLASASRYYELYYDGFKSHGYARKIRALHKLYG
jgi:hypothetical protein